MLVPCSYIRGAVRSGSTKPKKRFCLHGFKSIRTTLSERSGALRFSSKSVSRSGSCAATCWDEEPLPDIHSGGDFPDFQAEERKDLDYLSKWRSDCLILRKQIFPPAQRSNVLKHSTSFQIWFLVLFVVFTCSFIVTAVWFQFFWQLQAGLLQICNKMVINWQRCVQRELSVQTFRHQQGKCGS